ncbi:hypothetical protein Patl1_26422 [Pistacia atlantica]|uniref:Uncharacterized protein n=1 Tax=Pistacia atlantica TaxID=434234 RepID=A0ACC1AZ23_9ROSI|nr:hypothetical protein Patl1_26422 [Pistacia atlantica]
MSALWSLGVVEQLGHMGLGVAYYLQYTLILVVLSGALVLGMYHILIQRFKLEYFRRVTAVGFAPFESLIFTSIIVPQASFLGHLSGIFVGLKRSGTYDFDFLEIESVTDPSLPSVRFIGNGRTLQMSSIPAEDFLLSSAMVIQAFWCDFLLLPLADACCCPKTMQYEKLLVVIVLFFV